MLPSLSPQSAPHGKLHLEHFGTPHGALAYRKNTQATEAAYHARYNSGTVVILSDYPHLLEDTLVRRNGIPAFTDHHFAEMLPWVGAPAATEHLIVSAAKRPSPVPGHANLEPGDVLGIPASPLMHIPLETCVNEPPAPKNLTNQVDINQSCEARTGVLTGCGHESIYSSVQIIGLTALATLLSCLSCCTRAHAFTIT